MDNFPKWLDEVFYKLAFNYGRQWQDMIATPELLAKERLRWGKALFNFYPAVIDKAIDELIAKSKTPDLDQMIRFCEGHMHSAQGQRTHRAALASLILKEYMKKNKCGDYADDLAAEIANGKRKFDELRASLKNQGYGADGYLKVFRAR